MANIILVILFGIIAAISLVIGGIIFYHFKKFNLPHDILSAKILTLFKLGSVAIIFMAFFFLILLFIL